MGGGSESGCSGAHDDERTVKYFEKINVITRNTGHFLGGRQWRQKQSEGQRAAAGEAEQEAAASCRSVT